MKESEITALAREYAEDIYSGGAEFIDEVEQVICWLSQRFCLVDKSVIKETWKEITNVYLAHQHITYDGARYLFNEVLFPDLGKEVEG